MAIYDDILEDNMYQQRKDRRNLTALTYALDALSPEQRAVLESVKPADVDYISTNWMQHIPGAGDALQRTFDTPEEAKAAAKAWASTLADDVIKDSGAKGFARSQKEAADGKFDSNDDFFGMSIDQAKGLVGAVIGSAFIPSSWTGGGSTAAGGPGSAGWGMDLGGAGSSLGPASSAGGTGAFSFGTPAQIGTGIDLGAVPTASGLTAAQEAAAVKGLTGGGNMVSTAAGGLPAAAEAGLTSLAPEALTADAWAAMNAADAAALGGVSGGLPAAATAGQTAAEYIAANAAAGETAAESARLLAMNTGENTLAGIGAGSSVAGINVSNPSLWDSTKAALTKQYVNADGSFKIADILKDGLTVAAVIKKLSEGPEVKNGTYNVQVPDRTMVGHTPIATPAGHVPGSGGVSWFTPHSFVNSGDTAALSAAQAKDAKRVAGLGALNAKNTDTYKSNLAAQSLTAPYTVPVYRNPLTDEDYMNTWNAAAGGMAPQQGAPMAPQQPLPARYLQGATDGMADQIPAVIDGKQPAAMAHGEFVVPADVVSHLGNGNSDAGAQHLYKMMDDIRTARTGTKAQGKQINPETFTAAAGGLAKAANYAKGGAVQHFATGGDLATGAASNITAVANNPALWQPYGGQLTAGTSALQQKAFDAYGNLGASGTVGGGGAAAGTASSQGYTAAQSTAQQAEAAQAQAINAGPAAQYIATQATPAQQAAAQGYNVNTASATNVAPTQSYNAAQVAPTQSYNAAQVAPTQGYQATLAGAQGYTANMLGNAQQATARDATSQGYNATLAGAAPTVEKTTLGAAPTSNYQANLNSYQMAGPAQVNTDRFIDNGNSTAYMTPYMQQVVENQQRDAQRQADVATTQRQSNQMKQGAFGGSRTAVMDAEAAKNLAAQKGDIQAAGLQSAYTNAQAQYNADQARGVGAQAANQQAGIQTGTANLGANLQTQGLGTQVGLQQSLANQNLQGQYGLAQGQMDNAGNMQNAQLASQTNLTNAGFQNQAGQFTANAANTANLQNAQQSNQVGMFNSGQQNQFSLANQAAQNEAAKFGANASNQAGIANAGLQSAAAQFGANANNTANITNAGFQNQASQFGANANNTAGLANAAAANQVGIANAGFQNQAGQFVANANNTVNATNAGFQQQANISNAGAINNATQFNAGSVNQNTLANAGFQNNAAIANAGYQNATNNNNAQLGTQVNLANTGATNQASQFTANAGNAASIANAGNQTQASVSSANNGTSAAIANQNYGLAAINATLNAGGVQQNTTQAGLNADYANWLAARDAPKAAATYGLTALPALNYAVQP